MASIAISGDGGSHRHSWRCRPGREKGGQL